jgi:major membrane immunogen (membrane-anchored lipoprotein)
MKTWFVPYGREAAIKNKNLGPGLRRQPTLVPCCREAATKKKNLGPGLRTQPTLVLCVGLFLLAPMGCSAQPSYRDGVYQAQTAEFHNGWKETVEVTIKGGKLDKISWDAVSDNPDIPINKKQYSKSGLYGMLAGGAQNEWCDQAKAAEDYILKYGVDSFDVDEEGHTDAISGCTVTVDTLALLAQDCLRQARR